MWSLFQQTEADILLLSWVELSKSKEEIIFKKDKEKLYNKYEDTSAAEVHLKLFGPTKNLFS